MPFLNRPLLYLALSTLVLPLLQLSAASPVPARSDDYWRGIYMCSESFFRGTCHWQHLSPEDREGDGTCLHMEIPGDDRIASFGPDWGIAVNLYRDSACTDIITGPMVCPGFPSMIGWWDVTKPMTELFVKAENIPEEMQAVGPTFMGLTCPVGPGEPVRMLM